MNAIIRFFVEKIFLPISRKTVRAPDRLIEWILGPLKIVNGRTLDRRIQWLLWWSKFGFQPQLHRMTVPKARKAQALLFEILEDERGPDVRGVSDHMIDAGTHQISARMYKSWGSDDPAPLIIFYHGGGFVLGDIEMYERICRRFCQGTSCSILSINYRLAPEFPFPAAVEDAWTAFRWAQREAEKLGVDPERIAVAGDSAGGSLAAAVSSLALERAAPLPAAQLLIYPAMSADGAGRKDTSIAQGFGFDLATVEWFTKQYLPEGHF